MLFMACYNDKMPQRNERKATFIESGILLLRLYTQSSHPHPPTVSPFAFSGSLALHEQRKRASSSFVCLPYKSHWKLRFKVQITSMGRFNTSSYACCPTPPSALQRNHNNSPHACSDCVHPQCSFPTGSNNRFDSISPLHGEAFNYPTCDTDGDVGTASGPAS